MSLVERLDEAFNQREKRWPTHTGGELDRNTVLSSSEALRCLRWSWFEKHDTPVDEDHEEDWGWALRGNYVEQAVIDGLKTVMEEDEELLWTGADQISFVDHGGKVSATPDGLYVLLGEDDGNTLVEDTCLIEVKSIDPRTNWDKLPRAKDVVQTNMAMGLINRLSEYTVTRCRLIYVDASQYTKQAEYPYDYDGGEALENAENRAQRLFEANDASQLPAEGAMDSSCKLCPYKTACGSAVVDYPKKVKAPNETTSIDADGSTVEILVSQYAAAKESADMAKQMMDDLKPEILTLLEPGKHEVSGVEVDIKEIAPRRTLDRKKLEADFGDLSSYEKVGSPSIRLTVKS